MRVTLVHPSGFNFVPGQPDFSVLANRLAPVGILSLAAWLERHGHPTAVHDCLGPQAPTRLEDQVVRILATQPDLVGFSATTSGFMDAVDMAALLKAARPGLPIVVGNAHASSLGAPLLESFPELDFLCLGEGEGPLLDLAEGKPPAEIPNLVWRDGARIVTNPRRPRLLDLDDLPFPAYEKLAGFPQGYHLPLFSYVKRHGATMITSRGCPYTCSFCDRTVFEHQYRFHSPAYIHAHMKHLRDRFGVRHVNFYDDLFTAHQGRITELCQRLLDEPLGMDFNCIIRTGHTSVELLRLLKRAGCIMVSLGVESADPGMMARHKAGVTLESVRDTVEKVHAAGLRAKGLFIFGLPGETPETFQRTSDFILSLDLDDMNLTKFSPLHGAPLWSECVSGAEGDFIEDWRLLNCVNPVFRPEGFASRAQMEELYNRHITRFYSSQGYRHRFGRRLWEHRWSLWHLLRHLPQALAAKRYFGSKGDAGAGTYTRHPRQPVGLKPMPLGR
ncbi:B12-binding domain-containing radical SAM protein [Geothrix oryzisoli]|uniref:B12-binding domain-containing radical SAM protein n=1 Tax=Geothrix oryzisoli TaxID=2922721 RepID=UPI001FAC9208|nr:radical SAM protein [Geothrix oryzisoli]